MFRFLTVAALLIAVPASAVQYSLVTGNSTGARSDSSFTSLGRADGASTVVGESFVAAGDGILHSFGIKLGSGTSGNFAFELASWNGSTATSLALYRSVPVAYTGPGIYDFKKLDIALSVGASYIGFLTASGINNPVQSVEVAQTSADTYAFGGLFALDTAGRSPLTGPRAGDAWTPAGGDAVFTAVFGATAGDLETPGLHIGVVPEPLTWAMLIAGFGLTGAAMRRRRASFSVARA